MADKWQSWNRLAFIVILVVLFDDGIASVSLVIVRELNVD